jgi:DNA-binding transcriptional ArsR family regulator
MSRAVDERVFKALADGRRRKILDLLKENAMTTGEICSRFRGLDRCTVMQHLAVLERADLIIVKREGRLRWNYIRHRRRRYAGEDEARDRIVSPTAV